MKYIVVLLMGVLIYSCGPSEDIENLEEVSDLPKWKELCIKDSLIEVYTFEDMKVVLKHADWLKESYNKDVYYFDITVDSLQHIKRRYEDPKMSFLLRAVPDNLPAEFSALKSDKKFLLSGVQYAYKSTLDLLERTKTDQRLDIDTPLGCFKITSIREQ